MKTFNKKISVIMLLIGMAYFTSVNAQKPLIENGMFVRVYNLEGKKINKGKLIAVSDTLLSLKRNSKLINLEPMKIGYIKTKHSAGNNVLMGTIIGGTSMAIIGAASADPDAWIFGYSASEGATAGAFLGGTAGAVVGGITILFKNSNTFVINGNVANWNAFMQIVNK